MDNTRYPFLFYFLKYIISKLLPSVNTPPLVEVEGLINHVPPSTLVSYV